MRSGIVWGRGPAASATPYTHRMEPLTWVLGVMVLGLGCVVAWLVGARSRLVGEEATARARAEEMERRASEAASKLGDERARAEASGRRVVELGEEAARLKERLENAELVRQELGKNEQRLKEAFGALSAEALKASRTEFIEQARPVFEAAKKEQSELVKPIGEVLEKTREKLEAIEKARGESFARLHEKIETVTGASEGLRGETERLTRALSRPEVRGRYGEIQLRRVAELAGMTSYCDFSEQESTADQEGNLLRPDMVVKLPNGRVIAVDAKTNTFAYIEAVNARDDAERERHMEDFARHVHEQAKKLGDKRYWAQYEASPEFVVMFVPGDHFIDAALSRRPELIEFAAQHNVILASPSTLIGLLRAVAVGWREHSLSEQARELFELGRELHDRAAVAFKKIDELGSLIGRAGEKYNEVVGSIDGRLVPTLRKFEEAGAKSAKTVADLKAVEGGLRELEAGSARDGAKPTPP